MQQITPLSSAAVLEKPTQKQPLYRRFSAKAAAFAVTISTVALSLGLPASASAEGIQSCDLVSGSVEANNRLELNVSVANPSADSYNVVLYNQGPIGVQSPAFLVGDTLKGDYDKVDVGYAGRRAVEAGVSATFLAAIAPLGVAPTPDNSTFCTGMVSLIDNPIEGTFFKVTH